MREPIGAMQNSSLVFADGFHVHQDKISGSNGVGHAVQPARLLHRPSKPEGIPADAIRRELECILDSPELKDKPMLRGFLSFVVEETLAGRAHEIKGYTVATQVFGRRKDFDPTIDPIVRIQAGRLRRALESYYSGRGRQDKLRIEIGKGSYVPTFSRLTPEKLRLVQSQQPAEMPPLEMEGSQDPSEIIPFTTGTGVSVAVMPLVNLTNDPDQEYMADGLTEELMSELARCHGLQVNASHSTMQWRGRPIGAREVGRKLGARFFLEGSLRREEQIIKFTIRLIDTATGMQIWGEQYKRDLGSDRVIELQEEIARSVAGRIGGFLGAIPQNSL